MSCPFQVIQSDLFLELHLLEATDPLICLLVGYVLLRSLGALTLSVNAKLESLYLFAPFLSPQML